MSCWEEGETKMLNLKNKTEEFKSKIFPDSLKDVQLFQVGKIIFLNT